MLEELEYYDRKGFVPSEKVRTIEDYLKESEGKGWALLDFETDPHKFIAEQIGVEDGFELLEVSDGQKRGFYGRFLTEPLPGIYAEPEIFEKIIMSRNGGLPRSIFHFYGIPMRFEKYGSEIIIPLIKKEDGNKEEIGDTICHETVHCVRNQNETLDKSRYDPVIETVAYNTDKKPEGVIRRLRYLPVVWDIMNLKITFPVSLYCGNKTASFFKKCKEEGLNPFYLFLRSDPSEYSRKIPIRDQLSNSDNPRFQIMNYRLGLLSGSVYQL